jgi:hypothetical protein
MLCLAEKKASYIEPISLSCQYVPTQVENVSSF